MDFSNAANKSEEQHKADFSKPLGPMLEAQGILSAEQVEQSGRAQAYMIAVRNALEEEKIDIATVIHETNVKKGDPNKPNFGVFSQCDTESQRQYFLKRVGLNNSHLDAALKIVDDANKNSSNVNQGHEIEVTPIGFIHMDLHAKNIENFGDIKQSALLAQRAIDAADALDRLNNEQTNAALGAKRGFKLWGDESPMLKDIVETCQTLNECETNGTTPDKNLRVHIVAAFDEASAIFENAGYPQLADNITAVKVNVLGIPEFQSQRRDATIEAPENP